MKIKLLKKTLVLAMLVLFIGSITTSTIATPSNTTEMNENIQIKADPTGLNPEFMDQNSIGTNSFKNPNTQPIPFADFMHGYIAYSGSSGEPEGPCYFSLDDPGDITSLQSTGSSDFIAGGTWTSDERWLGCEYGSGALWEINPNNGDMSLIGGGGTGCNGLAWDPVYDRLYGTDGSNLIEYDPDNGAQTVIGSHNVNNTMIALAISLEGICYAWDVLFTEDATFFTVDLENGNATVVGTMGENLVYAQDGAFDWETGILYLTAYSSNGFLAAVDTETGLITHIGDFEGGAEVTGSMIGGEFTPPEPPTAPTITGPTEGDPNTPQTFTFHSSDPDGGNVRYYIDWGDGSSEVTDWYPACTPVDVIHTYTQSGRYTISAYAEDESGLVSPTSTYMYICPKDKSINKPFLNWLQSHPNWFPILQKLIQNLGL
jgi:hypothetical protein